jgi:hypothetical protein
MPPLEERDTLPAPPWHLLCSECRGGVEHFDVSDHADVIGYRHASPACAAWREHRAVVIERSAFEEKKPSGKTA